MIATLSSLSTPSASCYSGSNLYSDHMLTNLLSLHEDMAVQLRTDAACTSGLQPSGAAAFLAGMLSQHEQAASQLRTQLKTHQAITHSNQSSPC
jgi:predicted 2-oxoglutarate/Fe(II)-dependent dioxygenase YbiX